MWTFIFIILIVSIVILNLYKTIKGKELPTKTINIIASLLIVLTGVLAITDRLKPGQVTEETLRKVIREELVKPSEPSGASNWADGIPQTENINLLSLFAEGLKYKKIFEYEKGIKAFEGALGLKDVKDSETAALYVQIGNCFLSESKFDEALGSYKQALSFAERAKDDEGKASALNNLGLIYLSKGDLDQALKYLEEALNIHKEIGYRQGEANALGNIGLIYQTKSDLDKALKYHQDALMIDKEIGCREGEAGDLGNIGLIYKAKGDLDQALKYHRDALKIHKEIGFRRGEANESGNIGNVYYLKGDLDQALKYLNEALRIFEEIGMPEQIGIAKRNIARISQQTE